MTRAASPTKPVQKKSSPKAAKKGRSEPPEAPAAAVEVPVTKSRSGSYIGDAQRTTTKLTLRLAPEIVRSIKALAKKTDRLISEIMTESFTEFQKKSKPGSPAVR